MGNITKIINIIRCNAKWYFLLHLLLPGDLRVVLSETEVACFSQGGHVNLRVLLNNLTHDEIRGPRVDVCSYPIYNNNNIFLDESAVKFGCFGQRVEYLELSNASVQLTASRIRQLCAKEIMQSVAGVTGKSFLMLHIHLHLLNLYY